MELQATVPAHSAGSGESADGTSSRLCGCSLAMFGHHERYAPIMTPDAFAALGSGEIAYVKSIRSENAAQLFPGIPEMMFKPGCELFALYSADGTPLMLAADRNAAIASADEFKLYPLSVH